MQMGGGALLRAQVGGWDVAATASRERLTPGEVAYVLDRRASCRASWQACANMVSRPVHDVRMACDPDYAQTHAKPAPVATLGDVARAARAVRPVLGDKDALLARVLAALADLGQRSPARTGGEDTPRISASAVAHLLGFNTAWVGQRLRKLKVLGLVVCDDPKGDQIRMWAVSTRGLAELARLEAAS